MEDNLKARFEHVIKELPRWLKEAGLKLPGILTGYIGGATSFRQADSAWKSGKSNTAFNPANQKWSNLKTKLRTGSGELFRSFQAGHPETLTKVSTSQDNVAIDFGSKKVYASIHETGGEIKSKGKMHKYFLAMYGKYKTNEFYKIMALSVIKKGGVTIPRRPYFYKGLKKFEQEGYMQWLDQVFNIIIKSIR